MRDQLVDLLEQADLAIASCAGVVEDTTLEPLIESVRSVRIRLAYPEDVLVVAFAGGTGSGKSSLFNAVNDAELADVGGVRPTTARPGAAVPATAASSLDGYLDRLGVEERHQTGVEGLCLLDLPDTDSVERGHRYRVDAMLPLVDVVVWVTDPEKYNDARLHHDYLQPLAAYSDQFVFVLNQIDRLTDAQAARVAADLERTLSSDGIEAPRVIPTSAAPPSGPPTGIDELVEVLGNKRGEGSALYGKLITDLEATVAALDEATGSAIDFDQRAVSVLETAAGRLVSSDVSGATRELTSFLDDVAGEVGGLSGEKIERLAGEVPQHVTRIDAETRPAPRRGRFARRSPEPERDAQRIRSLVNEAVFRPVRAVLAKRALAGAAVAELAVNAQSLR